MMKPLKPNTNQSEQYNTLTPLPVPFARCYWVIPGKLLAGCYPGDSDEDEAQLKLQALVDSGIRTFISLMEEDEVNYQAAGFEAYEETVSQLGARNGIDVECLRFAVRDLDVPSPQTMRAILDAVDGSLAADKPVYVHCWGGRGRTGTLVGCYLARHGIAMGEKALEKLQELRRNDPKARHSSPQTAAQRAMVRSWREGE